MELVGAGAITRIVVSSPAAMRDAVLRVRVDGGAQPAFEWPLRELKGVIAPRFAPFVAWHPAKDLPREGDVGGGTIDCILPMPFARSCIVTLDRRPELYRIESIAFADGVRVEPFARESLEGIGDARFAAVRADVAARASLRPTAQSVVRARSPASPSLPSELSASPLAAGARVVELDVTDDGSVDAAMADAVELAGSIDVVINNAGVGSIGLLETFTPADWQASFDINVFGVQRVNRAALPLLRAQGSGLLVIVSSVAGRMAVPFFGPYNAAKFAVEGLAETYRAEL